MFRVIETTYEDTIGDYDYRIIVKEGGPVWIKRKLSTKSWFTAPSVQIWTGVTWRVCLAEDAKFADLQTLDNATNLVNDSWIQSGAKSVS